MDINTDTVTVIINNKPHDIRIEFELTGVNNSYDDEFGTVVCFDDEVDNVGVFAIGENGNERQINHDKAGKELANAIEREINKAIEGIDEDNL